MWQKVMNAGAGMDENTKEPVINWALVFSSIWMKGSVPELSRPCQALKLGNFKSIEQNVQMLQKVFLNKIVMQISKSAGTFDHL